MKASFTGILGATVLTLVLAACGGAAPAPSSSAPAPASVTASKPAASPAASAAASKPAASAAASGAALTSAGASAKPAASGAVSGLPAASGSASALGASSGVPSGAASAAASAKPAASGPAAASPAASAVPVPLPAVPAPIPASLDASSTAFLILDITNTLCQPQPPCVAIVPKIAALLKKARDAKATVIYSLAPIPNSAVMPEVAPQSGDPTVTALANKFTGTNLADTLKAKGIKQVVITGWSANGAVLYTAYEANTLGYQVVVAEDGMAAASPGLTTLTEVQLLQQPGHSDPNNQLGATDPNTKTPTVALSTSDLITFK